MADDQRLDDVAATISLVGRDAAAREKLWTVEEFERLGELGLLAGPCRHELWNGRIMVVPAPDFPHMDRERRLVRRLILAIEEAGLGETYGVFTGGGIRVGEYNLRGPDVMVARLDPNAAQRPTGEETVLLVEVAQSSLPDDLTEKRGTYAAAGVLEYWVIDVARRRLHAFRRPRAGDYPPADTLEADAVISPLFAPAITLAVKDFV
jgi:Uma2 family endonuclease